MIIHRATPGIFTSTLTDCYLVGYEYISEVEFIFFERILPLGAILFHSLEDEIMIETIWGSQLSDCLDGVCVNYGNR